MDTRQPHNAFPAMTGNPSHCQAEDSNLPRNMASSNMIHRHTTEQPIDSGNQYRKERVVLRTFSLFQFSLSYRNLILSSDLSYLILYQIISFYLIHCTCLNMCLPRLFLPSLIHASSCPFTCYLPHFILMSHMSSLVYKPSRLTCIP